MSEIAAERRNGIEFSPVDNKDTILEYIVVEPKDQDYRNLPIEKGFDWPAITERLDDGTYYLVVFRSQRLPDADGDLIAKLDHDAHEEAKKSKALHYYFAGGVNVDPSHPDFNKGLSWCLWDSREEAVAALTGPAHQEAVHHVEDFYGTPDDSRGCYEIGLFDVTKTGDTVAFHAHDGFHSKSQADE